MSDTTQASLLSKINKLHKILNTIYEMENGFYAKYNESILTSKKNDIANVETELNGNGLASLEAFARLPENSKIPADRISIVYQGRLERLNASLDTLRKDLDEKHWTFEYKIFGSIKEYLAQYPKDSEEYKASFARFGNRELKTGYALLKSKQVIGIDTLLKKDFSKYNRQMMITDANNNHKVVSILNKGSDTTDELSMFVN